MGEGLLGSNIKKNTHFSNLKVKDLEIKIDYEYKISSGNEIKYIRKLIGKHNYIEVSSGLYAPIPASYYLILEFREKYSGWDVIEIERN